ncbi:DUF930 domain-containing protein [Rhizobium sp. 32-5/1]|uniref:DUF930 domain-containing protein n=1 Tax=Rhizobium sp. 32-5/1 TaxID=3019602 RepID=UPI00240E1327|nr:DUF930 domain-containing protein [Rhizobium sp. 32-5/1]WEZ82985.1 DUF930 domain-containing protein [Rhizobium sp. 32-5/1]
MMQQDANRYWQWLSLGTIVSVALHLVLGAVLLVQLPMPDLTPPEEESISVEIVPPPPEEVEKPVPEETAKEGEAKKEEPPPAEEQQQAQPPAAQQEQPATEQQTVKAPIPVLRPVFEFGEKDTGAKDTDDGNAARQAAKPPPDEATPSKEQAIKPAETAKLDNKPDIETPTAVSETDTANAVDPLPSVTETELETSDAIEPEPDPETETAAVDIPEAKKLFSEKANDDPVARAAMGNLSRGQRVARLCTSELYAQLKNGSPSYNPDLVPSYELAKGNELTVPKAAFRVKNRWYDFAFRCEVDDDAMRVQSFGVDVGKEVPKSQWRSRKFPNS